MILYHGTSARYLKRILKKGLLPRKLTGKSNWEGDVASKEMFVYLSKCYPVYFALAAIKDDDSLLILKVDVEEAELYPDEDYISKCLHAHHDEFKDVHLRKINPHVALDDYKHHWVDSLKNNGLVSVKDGIPHDGIVDYVIMDPKECAMEILNLGGDAVPIPMNYKLYGPSYEKGLEVLFATRSPREAVLACVNANTLLPPEILAALQQRFAR